MWNSRNTLEVASNHHSIRHKLLTVCSPPKQSNKIFRPQYERLYPEILSRWSKQDLQWFCDNFLWVEEVIWGICCWDSVSLHISFSELHRKLKRALVQTKVHHGSVSFPLCPAGPECWVIDHLGVPLSDKPNKSIANPLCVVFQPHALMYS